MSARIYLDHAATTPLRPEAREAMAPWLEREFGNASSLYEEGRRAKEAIDAAREVVSSALGCLFGEVVFTSSGTEAANLALVGSVLGHEGERRRVVVSEAEHHCVLNTRPLVERLGFVWSPLMVDEEARPDMGVLFDELSDNVLLVATMHANNELGTVTDVRNVVDLARQDGCLVFCDAVQTFPWCCGSRWTVGDLGADLVCVSAHKLGGPKGVGALYVRSGVKVAPLSLGGAQEREMRAGTENVAAIVGFAAAVQASVRDAAESERKARARDAFRRALIEQETPRLHTLPDEAAVLPGHLHVRFEGVSAESLLILLDRMGVAASAGAACSSGSIEPSHVLVACGWGEAAKEGVRFTFGSETTEAEAVEAARRVGEAASRIARSG
jgi:cysteine desulfurase